MRPRAATIVDVSGMAVIVKVLVPEFQEELAMPPLVKVKNEGLLISLVRSLPKISVLPKSKLLMVRVDTGE